MKRNNNIFCILILISFGGHPSRGINLLREQLSIQNKELRDFVF
jgi:hypothetical protein